MTTIARSRNLVVGRIPEAHVPHRDRVMADRPEAFGQGRHVRIDEKPHAGRANGSSRSCTAAAAYASAAGMSSASRSGKSARISSAV